MNFEINTVLLMTIFIACYAVGVDFFACDIGQRISNAFNEINDVIGKFDWYLFPNELQKLLPIIIHFAQLPVEMKFFGSIACNRDSLKKVRMLKILFRFAVVTFQSVLLGNQQ